MVASTHADFHVRTKEMNGKYKSIGKKQSSLLVFYSFLSVDYTSKVLTKQYTLSWAKLK